MYTASQRPPLLRIIILCIFAEVLNLGLPFLFGDLLGVPLFLDTIGTVFIVFYAGLIPGLIVGGLYNILRLQPHFRIHRSLQKGHKKARSSRAIHSIFI